MSRTRFVFFLIIGVAAFFLWRMSSQVGPQVTSGPGQANTPSQTVPAGNILLTVASSSTKQDWMEKVAEKFMREGSSVDGKKITVRVSSVSSGGSTNAILDGKLKPVAWSPGVDSWVKSLNQQWEQNTGAKISAKACRSSIYSPLGLAMWRPMAEALGWPDKPVGWKTIVELVSDDEGWARYGHPEWGKFRLGHAHPKYSNSGLLTMTSFVYGMTGKTADLDSREVYAPKVEKALRALAQNTAKYGMVTEHLMDLLAKNGPNYLHAVATYESNTLALNLDKAKQLRFPLAFIFPAEGAFWGDHPYCILDNTDWVSPEQAQAAEAFYAYMTAPEQQEMAIDSMLRPLDESIPLRAPLTLANGTDPTVTPQKIAPLTTPDADLSAAIIDLFMITKRKATVMAVLDTSGSMSGDRIRTATEATANFLRRLALDDRVGVLIFNTTVSRLTPLGPVQDVVESSARRVSTLLAGGNTALYEAVCQSHNIMQEQQRIDREKGENRLYGIILLSDGANTVARPTENQMFSTCLPSRAEAEGIKIFPIAFGDAASEALLNRIATVTGGSMFKAQPDTIEKIYLKISAEQ